MAYTMDFSAIGMKMIREVGDKNAFLGEMTNHSPCESPSIPPGFAITASAYRRFLRDNDLEARLRGILNSLDACEFSNLAETGMAARALIASGAWPVELEHEIRGACAGLMARCPPGTTLAVRASATGEESAGSNREGKREAIPAVDDADALLEAARLCFASLFTDDAIRRRVETGVDHVDVTVAVCVQRLIRSDKASCGKVFTVDPETGDPALMSLTGSFGIQPGPGDAPDRFLITKGRPPARAPAMLSRARGTGREPAIHPPATGPAIARPSEAFCLSVEEVIRLATCCQHLEDYYGQPMEIEWAKDGPEGGLFIVRARPELLGVH